MSLQKFAFISLVAVLFVIDVVFSILLLKKPDNNNFFNNESYRLSLMEVISHTAKISSSDVVKALPVIAPEFSGEERCCGIIMPPYPCGGCIVSQSQYIIDFSEENPDFRIEIFAPYERCRDLKANFSKQKNIEIHSYQYQELEALGSPIVAFDGFIYFHTKDSVCDVFVSNKVFPEITEYFFEKILP